MNSVLFAAAAVALSLVALHGRARVRCLATQLGSVAAFAGLASCARVLHVDVDSYLVLVAFGAVVLAVPLGFLAFADEVRWSADRAFVIAAIGYAVMIPLQLRTPIDGDEPYYLMMTESLVRDHDLDLANQYRDIATSDTGRPDLVPQPGDPRGRRGEQYSRHEPFLPILMMPGYALGGVPGALAVIALFGALLARSTVRFLEDEGISDPTTRTLFPLIAFGPPIIFYATRVWPEVPAAFCLVEAVRGIRNHRGRRWIPAVFGLVLLKIRFGLIAIGLLARALRTRRQVALAAAVVAVPLLVAWMISGNPMNTHSWRELIPHEPFLYYWRGLFGLVLDGQSGILIQAPMYLLAIIGLARWRAMPEGFRLGISASVLYILYLVPRSEWHGGWSPPLRYIVVLMPVLALGSAVLWEKCGSGARAIIAGWTVMIVVHGAAFPWRLFHLATGENFIGESMSARWQSDFSRLMPSFIRPNVAASVASIGLIALLMIVLAVAVIRAKFRESSTGTPSVTEGRPSHRSVRLLMTRLSKREHPRPAKRGEGDMSEANAGEGMSSAPLIRPSATFSPLTRGEGRSMLSTGRSLNIGASATSSLGMTAATALAPMALAALLLAAFAYGRLPADRVEFEDTHVTHEGGEIYPPEWTVSRFLYPGGWIVHRGDALSFLAKPGRSVLSYQSRSGATIEIGGRAFVLPATGGSYSYVPIHPGGGGRMTLRCLDGAVNLDWMQHD